MFSRHAVRRLCFLRSCIEPTKLGMCLMPSFLFARIAAVSPVESIPGFA
jgi:hypothetical protein